HFRYANRVTFQFEKCKPALARRVGHDARQTSRARRRKSRARHSSGFLWRVGVQPIEMEDHAMSLIRNGYAVSTRRGFLGGLFSALLALALFDTGAAAPQQVKQIKLTDKHIQGFMAAYDHIAKLYYGGNPDKPDPKLEAHAAAVAKKNGFAGLAQYEDVSMNIMMIMSGIDPQTKKFTDAPELIKDGIAALKADK